MEQKKRKHEQKTLNDIDDQERIEAGYWLGRFHKALRCILVDHKKPLSWIAQYAGKSKPWWGMALKDSTRKREERSAIVIHGRELKSVILIAELLSESEDIANKKLAARLDILRAQSELNKAINAYLKVR